MNNLRQITSLEFDINMCKNLVINNEFLRLPWIVRQMSRKWQRILPLNISIMATYDPSMNDPPTSNALSAP
jgi:hypothetical protein